MASDFWWVFDALVVVIAIGVIVSNAKKGLTKVFVLCMGYLIATVVAAFASAAAAPSLYETVARPSNMAAIEEVNDSIDVAQCFKDAIDEHKYGAVLSKKKIEQYLAPPNTAKFDKNLYYYVNEECGYQSTETLMEFKQILTDAFVDEYCSQLEERLPGYFCASFTQQMNSNPALINTVLEQLYKVNNSSEDSAGYIEDNFGAEPTTECFRIFVYIIIFSIVMIIAGIIANATKYRIYFNVLTGTDRFLGALLGFIEAAAVVIITTLVIRLIVLIGGGEFMCFNEETISQTYIYKYIYAQLGILI